MKRIVALAGLCAFFGCAGAESVDTQAPAVDTAAVSGDAGHGDGGYGCDGDEAAPGFICGYCRKTFDGGPPCFLGACVNGVCQSTSGVDGGEADAGKADGGPDGCDGDEGKPGYLCGSCLKEGDAGGESCLQGVCVKGVCISRADGGADAG